MSTNPNSNDFDNTELLAILCAYIVILADVKKHIGKKEVHEHGRRLAVILPIIDGIITNLQAISVLIEKKYTNEAHVIARSFFERTITLLYLQCCDEKEFERYISHTKQKSYRVLTQPIILNGKNMTYIDADSINLEEYPELKKSVETFTRIKSKKEIKRWSKTSLQDKLELINKSGIISPAEANPLLLFLSTYYDDASEAIHSTMYGCCFHFGGFSGSPKSQTDDEINIECNSIREGLLSVTSVTAGIIIKYLSKTYGLKDLSDVVNKIREKLLKEIERAST